MAKLRSIDTLRQQLIQGGVDPSHPEFIHEENERVAAAMNAVSRPVNPIDEQTPESYKRIASQLHAMGRIGTLLQVVLISGGIGPIINLGLIIADTVRINHAIAFFEHEWAVALLLSIVTIFSYTYLSFIKSDLKYILRKHQKEVFSLKRVREQVAYWRGTSHDWQPKLVSQTEVEYKRVSGFYTYFKTGIFILLFLSSIVTVMDDSAKQPDRIVEHVSGAVGSVIITMLLLSALDLQIDRSYKQYMSSEGGKIASLDFFESQLEAWQTERLQAGEKARQAFYMMQIRQAQQSQLPATTNPSPSIILTQIPSQNGHSKPIEETRN
jgi:hypothetical protein